MCSDNMLEETFIVTEEFYIDEYIIHQEELLKRLRTGEQCKMPSTVSTNMLELQRELKLTMNQGMRTSQQSVQYIVNQE